MPAIDSASRSLCIVLHETLNLSASSLQDRNFRAELRNLPLWTAQGDKVPLASLARFRVAPGPDRIQRQNRGTSIWVGARYEEGNRQDYMNTSPQMIVALLRQLVGAAGVQVMQ